MVKVVVYTISDCEECELTLSALAGFGRKYEEIKLDRFKDIDTINAFLVKGFGKFPVVSIDDWRYSWCGHNLFAIANATKSDDYYLSIIKRNFAVLKERGYSVDDVINYLSKGSCWKPAPEWQNKLRHPTKGNSSGEKESKFWKPSPDYIEFVMGER